MRLRRRPREVYRVYAEDELPGVDEWAEPEVAVGGLRVDFERESDGGSECELGGGFERESAGGFECEPGGGFEPVLPPAWPEARLRGLRRVAVMALLGAGVGIVAGLALHSLRTPPGVDGRRGGGVAQLPPHALPAPAASVPYTAPAQRGTLASAAVGRRGEGVRGARPSVSTAASVVSSTPLSGGSSARAAGGSSALAAGGSSARAAGGSSARAAGGSSALAADGSSARAAGGSSARAAVAASPSASVVSSTPAPSGASSNPSSAVPGPSEAPAEVAASELTFER